MERIAIPGSTREQGSRAPIQNSDRTAQSSKSNGTEEERVSVIGSDIKIKGDIEATADLVVEGKVEGNVRCATLILGAEGSVNGNVDAERVRVSGLVEGEIHTGDLAIEGSGRVNGNIEYERLRVANGGEIKGQMNTRENNQVVGRIGPVDGNDNRAAMTFEDPSLAQARSD